MRNELNNATLASTTLVGLDVTRRALAATTNTTNPDATTVCALSPHACALSSVLTAFVGTTLTGLSSGQHVAFMVGWVYRFASLRIVLVGIYQVNSVTRLELPEGGEHFFKFLDVFSHHELRKWSDGFFRGAVEEQVSFLGWTGWIYTTLYSPTIQVMWLLENWDKASTGLKFARAIGVGVAALPSTFDIRARYRKALGKLCGRPAAWLFGALTAASTVTLAGVAVTELGLAAKGLRKSAWMAAIYVVFTLVWTYGSLVFASPHDDAKALRGWLGRLGGVGTGAFAGLFVAAPSFGIMMAAQDHPGIGLSTYSRCEGTTRWQKMVALLP